MSLVIEGEHLHRLCLMCNPIGYCIYSDPHTPPPPNLECSMYMLKVVKKKRH